MDAPDTPIALVTGGARGIGAAIAQRIVSEGGSVVVADVDDLAGEQLVAHLGSAARFVHCDVTSENDLRRTFAQAEEEVGALSAVFANAGAVGTTGPLQEHTLEDWHHTLDLLLTSVFITVKHAIAVMRPREQGSIVCTASVAAHQGGLGPHAYTAAKHGVLGLVRSAAVEVAPYGLRINAVSPGGAVSSLSAGMMGDVDDLVTAYDRLALASSSGVPTTAEDVAEAAVFLSGPRACRINGTDLVVDGADYLPSQKGRSYYS